MDYFLKTHMGGIGHDDIYRVYFHGPAYRVLEMVNRLSSGQVVGTTSSARLVTLTNTGTAPVTIALALPELAGRRLMPFAVAGLPAGSPVDVAGDGGARVTVPARAGFVLAAAG